MPASPLSMTNYAAMDEDEDVFSQVDDHDSSEEDDCDYGFRIEPEESIFPDYDGIGSMGIPQPPSLRFGAGPGPSAEAKMDHYPILSRTGLPTPPPSVRSSDDAHRRGSFASSLPDESVLSVTADVACSSTRGM